MNTPRDHNHSDLFAILSREVAHWEDSPYYLADEELFDLERFLKDHRALDVLEQLQRAYGTPLNRKFWSSSLAYHKLRRAREAIKSQEAHQDAKRREYLQSLEASRRDWQNWVKEWTHDLRRRQMRLVHPPRQEENDPQDP